MPQNHTPTLRPDPEGKGWIFTQPDGGTSCGTVAQLLAHAAALGLSIVKEAPCAAG